MKAQSKSQVIDEDGYRANVGIILCNRQGKLLWARRIGRDAWQFPQGGMLHHETPEQAMYRELHEEVGLHQEDVDIMGKTRDWLRYRLPKNMVRRHSKPVCIGQKQVWFMLSLQCDEASVCLDASDTPEFDQWRWVDYWRPLDEVISFKRRVYRKALKEFIPLVFPDDKNRPPYPKTGQAENKEIRPENESRNYYRE